MAMHTSTGMGLRGLVRGKDVGTSISEKVGSFNSLALWLITHKTTDGFQVAAYCIVGIPVSSSNGFCPCCSEGAGILIAHQSVLFQHLEHITLCDNHFLLEVDPQTDSSLASEFQILAQMCPIRELSDSSLKFSLKHHFQTRSSEAMHA
jgi:hypothetical protein